MAKESFLYLNVYGNHLFLLNVYIKTFYFDGTVIKGLQLIRNMIVLVETFGFIKSNIVYIIYRHD